MTSSEIQTVLSAVRDGRSRDLRYRQRQLSSLHRWIVENSGELQQAICRDDTLSDSEARFVVAAALVDIRTVYDSLDLKKELKAEYSIKRNQANEGRRLPEELVYLTLEKYTILYSLVNVLSACIAAGSCCLIELPSDLRYTSSLLRRCLNEALDNTTITVVNSRPSAEILNRCLVIDQAVTISPSLGKRSLVSAPAAGAVAIVDRTANIGLAAREIIHAVTILSGRGPYAPAWILVNEFVETQFIEALKTVSSHATKASQTTNGSAHPVREISESDPDAKTLNFVFNAKDLKLTKVSGRNSLARTTKKQQLAIPLLAISSHDDAIDALGAESQQPLSACYVFADPSAAKYLTQFVPSRASFVNHIPARLLIGPAAPIDFTVSSISRYRREMIEIPAPQFIKAPPSDTNASSSRDTKFEEQLYNASIQPLKPMGQPKEGDMNFFAQAMLTSYVFVVSPLVIGSIAGAGYLGMKLYGHMR